MTDEYFIISISISFYVIQFHALSNFINEKFVYERYFIDEK